jgi:hypothetical protein
VLRWGEFEAAAPEVATRVRELFDRYGFAFAGTIRRDGTPRISPVEVRLVEGELVLVLIAGTHKARDLRRDPRIVLNSPVVDPEDPGAEFKLRGRVVDVDEAQRTVTAEAVKRESGWRPPPSWHVLAVRVDDVAHLAWERGALDMLHWTEARGTRRLRRPAPELG